LTASTISTRCAIVPSFSVPYLAVVVNST
jgi:hypothetical protein